MEGQTNRQVSSAGHPRRVSHPKGSRRPVSCSGYREKRPVYSDNSPGDRENSPGYRENSSACHDDCSGHHENNVHPLRSPRPASSSGYLGHHHQPRSGEDTRSPSASGERHRHPRRTSRPASSTVYSGSRLYAKRSSRPSSGYPGSSSPTRSKRPWTAPVSGHRSHREDMDSEEEYPEGRGRGSHGGRRLAWQCTEEARKKHEELLRKILEEFDLERTKEKYRNAYVIERQRNGKSVADYQFRAELERMMGSEVIRINDKTWSKRFTEKLLEDYYKYEDEQALRRAEEEKLRIHKLKVLGLIQEQQPYERRLTITRMQEKWKRMSCKPPHELDEAVRRKLRRDDELNHRRMTLNTRRQTNIYTGPSLTIEENVGKLNLKDSDVDGVAESKPRVGLTAEDRRQRAAELMRQKRFSKVLPDDVQKIYYEETVEGLYNMAERLVIFR